MGTDQVFAERADANAQATGKRGRSASLRIFFLILAFGCAPAQAAPELPAIMLLVGRIAAGPSAQVAPRAGDQVLAFSAVDGLLVGSGPVTAQGDYFAVLTRTA